MCLLIYDNVMPHSSWTRFGGLLTLYTLHISTDLVSSLCEVRMPCGLWNCGILLHFQATVPVTETATESVSDSGHTSCY